MSADKLIYVDISSTVCLRSDGLTNDHPIGQAEFIVAEKPVVDRGNVGSPHQN
jgi:hypothetical protein